MWVLIAAILVLAITVIALISVFESYNTSQQQMSVQNAQSAVATSISAINTAFAQNPNFANFNGTVAQQIGAVPTSWASAGNGSYVLPGGGTVTFGSANINGGTNNGYTMTFSGIGQQFCVGLGTFTVPQMATVSVNGNNFQNPSYNPGATGTGTGTGSWPPSSVAVAGLCTASSNTVVYTLL